MAKKGKKNRRMRNNRERRFRERQAQDKLERELANLKKQLVKERSIIASRLEEAEGQRKENLERRLGEIDHQLA